MSESIRAFMISLGEKESASFMANWSTFAFAYPTKRGRLEWPEHQALEPFVIVVREEELPALSTAIQNVIAVPFFDVASPLAHV